MTLHQLSIRHYRGAALAASLCGALRLLAQVPFELDTDYRTTIEARNVNGVHLLPDGKLFLSGQIRYPGEGLTFRGSMRLLFNGERDLLFQSFPFSTGGGPIIPWNDGKFYVQAGGVVRRLHPDGAIDQSFAFFGDDPYVSPSSVGGYHVFPDGRVVTSGDHLLSDIARGFVGQYNWVWFTNTGRLDTTRIHRQANFPTGRFTALPNGQFICHGQGSSFDGQAVDKLFKLNADGSVDTSFQSGVYWGVVKSYATLADNRFYAGGSFMTDQLPGDSITIARFLPNGSIDPSFAIPEFDLGELTQTFGPQVFKIVPLPNGNIIAAGKFQFVNGQPRGGICLLDSNGVLLDAFANASVGTYVYMNYEYTSISDVVIDSANNYLYLCGAYVGYSDGTTSDPTQRFVTRLHLGDIMTGTAGGHEEQAAGIGLRIHPNPSGGQFILTVGGPPMKDARMIVHDMTGRAVHRSRMEAYMNGGGHAFSLDVPAGLYRVTVQYDGGKHSATLVVE